MKLVYVGGGGYRISDADAAKLARGAGRKLPKHGYSINTLMPNGEEVWLQRMTFRYSTWSEDGQIASKAPKRGWVWIVMGEDLSDYTKPSLVIRRHLLRKAKQAASHAKKLETEAYYGDNAHTPSTYEKAMDAYLVSADAFEEAGDLAEARGERTNADRLRSIIKERWPQRDPRRHRRTTRRRRRRR
jgi:hypothetical protein